MTDNLPTEPGSSPFDALRRVRDDGSEYWSARNLMPYFDYSRWDNFTPVIERAIATAENTGVDVAANFLLAQEVSGSRGPKREDVQLSRYGAYLVAMNGDPRKPEVAAMQTYFAVRTRQAEVAERPALPQTYAEALRALADEVEAKELAEAKVLELQPGHDAFQLFIDRGEHVDLDVVSDLIGWGALLLRAQMRELRILKNGGRHHNLPYADHEHRFKVVAWDKERGGSQMGGYVALLDPRFITWLNDQVGPFADRPKDLMKRDRKKRVFGG